MYLGEDGEVHGFYVDLEKMVMEEMGQSYHFVPYSDVGPVIQGLKSGIYHLALAVPDLPDYRTFVNLSIPYELLHYVTFVQEGNTQISGSSRDELIKSLNGKKVGVQTQGHIYQSLRDYKEIELIEYPTTTKALEDLNRGIIDAVPDVKRIGLYYAERYNWHIVPVGDPIISHKITTGISQMIDMSFVKRYNTALGVIIADGRLDRLYSSYFGPINEISQP
jgi:ABC-type amino acid transport substrate-binding protein